MSLKNAEAAGLYSVHPMVAYGRAIVENLPAKTGKSMGEWVALLKRHGPESHKAQRDWLKKEQGLGGTTAFMIADHAHGKGDTDPAVYLKNAVGYVEKMYGDSKAGLRPIHDHLIELGRALGDDVRICPCKTIVPLYRNHVFAEIKPSTRTRIDLGLALRKADGPFPKRVLETGGLAKGDRITHRFALTAIEEVDAEVRHWLQTAYGLGG